MKVRILLTTLLLALLCTGAVYAHDGGKGKCCADKCSHHTTYVDDCDFCGGLFRGWGGWRHEYMYHHSDACCSKEMKKDKECSMKHCEDECDHHWRSHRAAWRHYHYYHHNHDNDDNDRG